MGCCGRYEYSIMGDAAKLFCALARVGAAGEIEESIVAALSRDYFLLGDPAKNTTLAVLNRCSQSNVSPPELAVFLESLWRLKLRTRWLRRCPAVIRYEDFAMYGS
jgi:hypothetical protein